MWRKKSRDGWSKTPDDKPTVHFTKFGGRYVKAEELFRSEKVREQLRDTANLFKNHASRGGSQGSD